MSFPVCQSLNESAGFFTLIAYFLFICLSLSVCWFLFLTVQWVGMGLSVTVAFPDQIHSSVLFPSCMWVLCSILLWYSVTIIPMNKWEMVAVLQLYSKTCVKRPLKIYKTKVLVTHGSLIKVESIAECSTWSILQNFWPALSDNWYWKPICGLFNTGFTKLLYCACHWLA